MSRIVAATTGVAGRSVVVLGGTGFLGGHICDAFGAAGARVLRVSRKARDDLGADRGPRYRSVNLDLADAGPRQLAGLLAEAEVDVVVNAAGMVWQATDRQMLDVNGELVTRLVAAVDEQPRRPRLIQLGSAYEYGPVPVGTSITEDQMTAPDTAYGRSKLLGTQAVLRAAHVGGLNGVVLRLAVVSGPGAPRNSLLGVVAAHLSELARTQGAGTPLRQLRLAPLRAQRDFVDVRDVADAVVAAATALEVAGRVVNIGRGEAVHVRLMVDRMITLSGLQVPITFVEGQGSGTVRSDAEWLRLDISRAWRLLGWRPRRSLDESLWDLIGSPDARESMSRPIDDQQNGSPERGMGARPSWHRPCRQ